MIDLEKLVRPNVWRMSSYSSSRDEFKGKASVYLDANESPFGTLNRYPDPQQKELKKQISKYWEVAEEQLFIGNGSDEVIDLVFRIFCEPQKDKALSFTPTYGMYGVCADLNDVEMIQLPLNENFDLDESTVNQALSQEDVKIIFLCSPNNPTGNALSAKSIENLITRFEGIVVVDEAYIQFSEGVSWSTLLSKFPNLLVIQTFSKALSLAGARVGMAFAQPEIIALLNKVKPPYNVSECNQKVALEIIRKRHYIQKNTELLKSERVRLFEEFSKFRFIEKIYPSEANFILIKVFDAAHLYGFLCQAGVIVRNRESQVEGCVRITVGSSKENNELIEALLRYSKTKR